MIEIQDVSKQFDCVTALRHLTLKVQDGSVFGLVGSNGAGKSTLLRILAGVYRPDSGRVLINGQAPFENEQVKRSTVFISDYPYLAPTATVRPAGTAVPQRVSRVERGLLCPDGKAVSHFL